MRTFDFFGLYVGFIWLQPGAPLHHTWDLHEIDEECRTSKAHFLRLWPIRAAIAFGRWRKSGLTAAEMFAQVFSTRELDMYDEEGNLDPRYAQAARIVIAENADNPDDEWEILGMMGLDK